LFALEDLEPFHDDASGDDRVGRCDGRNDIARHRFDVKPTLLGDAKNLKIKRIPNNET
jgi:hypothetical protein